MKCKRCGERAEIQLRSHNAAFCRSCFVLYFQRQVERAIHKQRMFTPQDRVLVARVGRQGQLGAVGTCC